MYKLPQADVESKEFPEFAVDKAVRLYGKLTMVSGCIHPNPTWAEVVRERIIRPNNRIKHIDFCMTRIFINKANL